MTQKDCIVFKELVDTTCPRHAMPHRERARGVEDILHAKFCGVSNSNAACADCWLYALEMFPDVLEAFNERVAATPDAPSQIASEVLDAE